MKVFFNGLELTEFLSVVEKNVSILPERQNYSTEIPSKNGAIYTGSSYKPRKIDLEVQIISDDFMEVYRKIAYILDSEGPAKLQFSDDQSFYYYAVLEGSTDIAQVLRIGRGTISFICYDVYAYSDEEKLFNMNPTNRKIMIENNGTAETFPKFTFEFPKDCGFVSLTSSRGSIMVGNPQEVDKYVVPPSEKLFDKPLEDLSEWDYSGTVVGTSGAVLTGIIDKKKNEVTKRDSFYPKFYGGAATTYSGWHGPGMNWKSPSQLDNWEVNLTFTFTSQGIVPNELSGDQKGRFEFNVTDQTGGILLRFVMRDSYAGIEYNVPELWLKDELIWTETRDIPPPQKVTSKENGKTVTHTVKPSHVGRWNDFNNGYLSIKKFGSLIVLKMNNIDGSRYLQEKIVTYIDHDNALDGLKFDKIHMWFGQWKDEPALLDVSVNQMTVTKHTVPRFTDVPNSFGAGDVLVIDSSQPIPVTLNGIPFMERTDFKSNFFSVLPGTTEVKINSSSFGDNFTAKAEIKERYI